MTAIFMRVSSKKKRALIVRFTGRLNKRAGGSFSGGLQFQLQLQRIPRDAPGESKKIDPASLNTSTTPVMSAATGKACHSAPSMGPTSTTDVKPSTTVIQRAHCKRNATQPYKPAINARDAIIAAMGSPGPVISANPISTHDNAYASPRHASAVESACLRHGARALGVCCNASFDNVLVVFMPAPAAWFFDASCCIRLIRGSLMHGSCQIADKLGTSLAFNFIAPYSGDLPDEMPLCCRRFYRDYRAKQSTKQRYDAATLQRCCTRWHALHSPPTSLPTRSQA